MLDARAAEQFVANHPTCFTTASKAGREVQVFGSAKVEPYPYRFFLTNGWGTVDRDAMPFYTFAGALRR